MGAVVHVIYHHFPHYRGPIMTELSENGKNIYHFYGGVDSVNGIEPIGNDYPVEVNALRFFVKGKRWILKDYWPAVCHPRADAVIIIGNPNMNASWKIALAARLLGKKVLFWGHGWLRPEPHLKRLVRNIYFRLPHRVLVYGKRAKQMAAQSGFPAERVSVIYNSLDYRRAQRTLARIVDGAMGHVPTPQSFFVQPHRPLIICTARLTTLCRFDLLFHAAASLEASGRPVNILLVGDGPERLSLERLATELGIDVHFFGACYDEVTIGNLIFHADITVSPGKIGLTAIHSLTYGTPAITHGDLDEQMPEVEAIEPGKTGLLFERDNAADLAEKIRDWLSRNIPREQIRQACQAVIAEKWNPVRQRELIEAAIDKVLARDARR